MVSLDYVSIGQRIRQRRKSLHLTQKDLAQMVGLSEGSVSRYENGKIEEATTSKLTEFAVVLKVEPMWLIGFKPEKDIERKTKEILKSGRDIPDEVMNAFLDMLETSIRIYKEAIK